MSMVRTDEERVGISRTRERTVWCRWCNIHQTWNDDGYCSDRCQQDANQ